MKPRKPAAQRGVFAVLFAVLLVAFIAFLGIALDSGILYERHTDMKNYANAAALAAARQLDGTVAGLDRAVDEAEDAVEANRYKSGTEAEWNEDALSFGSSADGPWVSLAIAQAAPEDELRELRYVRVDAGELDAALATVPRFFAIGASAREVTLQVVSVAGPTEAAMLPLAVCAMNETRYTSRAVYGISNVQERVEHGFRVGVTYNLLRLNPDGTDPVNFVVNPVEFPGGGATPDTGNFEDAAVAPFVCSGSMLQPRDNRLFVQAGFPATLIAELNSRFEQASSCVSTAALPDRNVADYRTAPWLVNNTGARKFVQESTVGGRLATVADVDPPDPAGRVKGDYGTVWSYARPVRFNAAAPGTPGASFLRAQMPHLYPVPSTPTSYPSTPPADNLTTTWLDNRTYLPYGSPATQTTFLAPAGTAARNRRVLMVPLLDCPVTGNEATVLAVGRFLMTTPASDDPADTYIAAEFGGLVNGVARPLATRLFQ